MDKNIEEFFQQGSKSFLKKVLNQGSCNEPPKQLWQQVKEIEEKLNNFDDKSMTDYDQAKGTLIVNFGANGRHTKGVVSKEQTLTDMLLSICEYFIENQPRWIPVEEKLPELKKEGSAPSERISDDVVITINGLYTEKIIAHYVEDQKDNMFGFDDGSDFFELEEVSHWFPLPELPNNK